MSFRGEMMSGSARPQPTNNGPTRDAWNNPIKEGEEGRSVGKQGGSLDNKDDKNNDDDSINDTDIDTIWDAVKKENSGGGQQQQQQQSPPALTAEEKAQQRTDYLKSVGLDGITLTDEDKEKLKNGDFEVLTNKMMDKVVAAHVKGLSGAQTMIDAAVEKAVKKAREESGADRAGAEALQKMQAALPFTKNRAISPVAQTVMQKFIEKGASTEDAIKGVEKFFAKTVDEINKSTTNRNRNGNFGTPKEGPEDDGGWLEFMRPGAR